MPYLCLGQVNIHSEPPAFDFQWHASPEGSTPTHTVYTTNSLVTDFAMMVASDVFILSSSSLSMLALNVRVGRPSGATAYVARRHAPDRDVHVSATRFEHLVPSIAAPAPTDHDHDHARAHARRRAVAAGTT